MQNQSIRCRFNVEPKMNSNIKPNDKFLKLFIAHPSLLLQEDKLKQENSALP